MVRFQFRIELEMSSFLQSYIRTTYAANIEQEQSDQGSKIYTMNFSTPAEANAFRNDVFNRVVSIISLP
jgi:hypothetical protein